MFIHRIDQKKYYSKQYSLWLSVKLSRDWHIVWCEYSKGFCGRFSINNFQFAYRQTNWACFKSRKENEHNKFSYTVEWK